VATHLFGGWQPAPLAREFQLPFCGMGEVRNKIIYLKQRHGTPSCIASDEFHCCVSTPAQMQRAALSCKHTQVNEKSFLRIPGGDESQRTCFVV
jgi:hypothetical protein